MSMAETQSRGKVLDSERRCSGRDEQLLQRFIARRDESAFAELVQRHAALVMGVCRRVLQNEQDAEDAFQATFLVLARKATSLRDKRSLSAWLYKTAHRIALRARAGRARRESLLEAEIMVPSEAFSRITDEHRRSVLDEELNRLPEKYRLPLFLCYLEGKSRSATAEQLGLSLGTIKGRLERGRMLLKRRLMLRGVSLSLVLAALLRSPSSVLAAPPVAPSLVSATVQAGMRFAQGRSMFGYVSENVLSLVNGSFQIMSLTTTKVITCSLFLVGTMIAIAGRLPSPAAAAPGGERTILLASAPGGGTKPFEKLVALLDDDEREGERREGERREVERDRPREGGRETERDERRDPERAREGDGERGNPLGEFRPQSPREAYMYRMILQLEREVTELRRALNARGGEGRDEVRRPDAEERSSGREGSDNAELPSGWERSKAAGIFRAYDKNRDGYVSLEEWLAMTNGNINDARRELQSRRFRETGPGEDGKLSAAEFARWWSIREGADRERPDRSEEDRESGDGERSDRDRRDGEEGRERGERER